MFAGFQPGTQVGLGVGRPGARVGAGRPGARRWIMPPTIDRNHLDTMDPATYALVRDMLTRQYLAAHGPALMAPPLSPVVAPRDRAHAPAAQAWEPCASFSTVPAASVPEAGYPSPPGPRKRARRTP